MTPFQTPNVSQLLVVQHQTVRRFIIPLILTALIATFWWAGPDVGPFLEKTSHVRQAISWMYQDSWGIELLFSICRTPAPLGRV